MKKSIRLLGVLFAVMTILSCCLFASAEDFTVTTDAPISVTMDEGYCYVIFTPEVTGTYKVTFKGDDEFIVYFEDNDYNSDSDNKIEILDNLTEGENYELQITCVSDGFYLPIVNLDISATLICTHNNTETVPAEDFTCTKDGSTEKVICSDCGWILQDAYMVPARHLDADNDYVCDVCGEDALLISDSFNCTDYDEDYNEINYTVNYKFYANGDLYIDGYGYFTVYDAYKLDTLFDGLYDPVVDDYILKIRNVYVGKDIYLFDISRGYGCEKYIIDPENKEYYSDSYGVLFSGDKKTLIKAPALWKETSYDIPDGVETIEAYSFTYAKDLKTVTIPSSVKYIGDTAFNSRTLTCDETVDELTYIGDALIDDTGEDIAVAKIREGTRVIAECVGYCDRIIYEIPASVEAISDRLYEYASAYFVDDNNSVYSDIDGVLFNKDKSILISYPNAREESSYVVPDGVKEIGEYAFSFSEIKQVKLPEGLEKVGEYAFYSSELYNIDLPSSLKEIGDYAFNSYLNNIKTVVVPANVEKIGDSSFDCDVIAILNPDCEIEYIYSYIMIVGYNGSTAEDYAVRYGNLFATLGDTSGENHKHIYFPKIIVPATCTTAGTESFSCPCGKTETYTRDTEANGHNWRWDFEANKRICNVCDYEETIFDDYECECKCHEDSNKLQMFFFKIKVFFWRLFKPDNRYCLCGDSHW